jgi:hypothetical protein
MLYEDAVTAIHPDEQAQAERSPALVAPAGREVAVTDRVTGEVRTLTLAEAWAFGHALVDAVDDITRPQPALEPCTQPCPDWCTASEWAHRAGYQPEHHRIIGDVHTEPHEWTGERDQLTVEAQLAPSGYGWVTLSTATAIVPIPVESARELIALLAAAVELAEHRDQAATAA